MKHKLWLVLGLCSFLFLVGLILVNKLTRRSYEIAYKSTESTMILRRDQLPRSSEREAARSPAAVDAPEPDPDYFPEPLQGLSPQEKSLIRDVLSYIKEILASLGSILGFVMWFVERRSHKKALAANPA